MSIALALGPVFALIALGYGLRKGRFLGPRGWAAVTKLAYFILYPCFLVPAIWAAEFDKFSTGPLAGAVAAAATLMSVAMFALRPLWPLPGPGYSSVFQGAVRWNAFVFLPVVGNLYGAPGLALGAIVIAALVPVVNIFCVLALSVYARGQLAPRALILSLLRNPILLACVAGLGLNGLGVPHADVVDRTLGLLGDAALPVGLVLAGSGLSFGMARQHLGTIAVTCVLKMAVMPLAMFTLAQLFGADPLACNIALLCGAAPGAAASYVLARQMGGDAPLMAGIVAATTVISAASMPLWLLALGAPG